MAAVPVSEFWAYLLELLSELRDDAEDTDALQALEESLEAHKNAIPHGNDHAAWAWKGAALLHLQDLVGPHKLRDSIADLQRRRDMPDVLQNDDEVPQPRTLLGRGAPVLSQDVSLHVARRLARSWAATGAPPAADPARLLLMREGALDPERCEEIMHADPGTVPVDEALYRDTYRRLTQSVTANSESLAVVMQMLPLPVGNDPAVEYSLWHLDALAKRRKHPPASNMHNQVDDLWLRQGPAQRPAPAALRLDAAGSENAIVLVAAFLQTFAVPAKLFGPTAEADVVPECIRAQADPQAIAPEVVAAALRAGPATEPEAYGWLCAVHESLIHLLLADMDDVHPCAETISRIARAHHARLVDGVSWPAVLAACLACDDDFAQEAAALRAMDYEAVDTTTRARTLATLCDFALQTRRIRRMVEAASKGGRYSRGSCRAADECSAQVPAAAFPPDHQPGGPAGAAAAACLPSAVSGPGGDEVVPMDAPVVRTCRMGVDRDGNNYWHLPCAPGRVLITGPEPGFGAPGPADGYTSGIVEAGGSRGPAWAAYALADAETLDAVDGALHPRGRSEAALRKALRRARAGARAPPGEEVAATEPAHTWPGVRVPVAALHEVREAMCSLARGLPPEAYKESSGGGGAAVDTGSAEAGRGADPCQPEAVRAWEAAVRGAESTGKLRDLLLHFERMLSPSALMPQWEQRRRTESWAEGLAAARTFATLRLHCNMLALHIQETIDNVTRCHACLREEAMDHATKCDGCGYVYHLWCCVPPLATQPPPDWRCAVCSGVPTEGPKVRRSPRGRGRGAQCHDASGLRRAGHGRVRGVLLWREAPSLRQL